MGQILIDSLESQPPGDAFQLSDDIRKAMSLPYVGEIYNQ
jgi:hypothetical protein